ncbi:MAG: CDP-glycerol--glycerophosphate glycerophosphotransferase [Fibrobacter sp.]|mgnify:CR=1 FL=1|nr:CDP-glycerol--glycerophosphate glycerophosphotransferase [Fibrobacter sp.]
MVKTEKKMHGFRARLDYTLKHNYALNRLFNWSASTFMKIWGCFIPMDKHLVVFSGHTRKYNDSPRSLYEYMLANPETYGKYKCVWALEDPDSVDVPGTPIKVKADTLAYFKYTLRAKYWVTCVNIERSLHYKKIGGRYLNTWHGTPFKHIGNDAGVRKDYNFGSMDYFCYASEYDKNIYMRAFRTRENAMIPTGLPRNDELYHTTPEEIKSIKERLGLPLVKKIILYAPTWRESTDNGITCSIKPPIDVKKWDKELKDDYIVLFRMHAYTNLLLGLDFNETLRDYSSYPSINDLFKISDILISDYSASMADYSILERPVLCFTYDYEIYRDERGLYVDYEKEMPSGILRTEDDVLKYIKTMTYDEECDKTRKMIKEKLIHLGGNATKLCLDKLFEK